MSADGMKALIARANNDKDFLRQLISNPEEAIRHSGYELTPQELEAVKASQPGQLTDEELEKRVSHGVFKIGL